MKTFYSHKDKPLEIHTGGVIDKTQNRTHLKIAEVAAIFHDLGKINPNFQRKLDGEKNPGYSSHAYLSTLAWLCFCEKNISLAKELIGDNLSLILSVATIIAKHHGNLPNLENGFFGNRKQEQLTGLKEVEKLEKFIQEEVSADDLPISQFLSFLEIPKIKSHNSFQVHQPSKNLKFLLNDFQHTLYKKHLEGTSDKLEFFLDTQFGFASLIESDKRDASLNEIIKRDDSKDFQQIFSANLAKKLKKLDEDSAKETDEKKRKLDNLRSTMREESLINLRSSLTKGERIFTLPAPTGAGKTLMLLSLANEILKHDEKLSVIYALPFLAITEQTENICLSLFENNPEHVLRVDSKSENKEIEAIQEDLDANPNDESLSKLMRAIFSAETFDHRFIITTFVQVFETLVSNRNAKLLRLPNFSKTIFLLDEIQALPPNLYTFFVAYLDEFCRKFDSYAVVSTATMPNLAIQNDEDLPVEKKSSLLFTRYKTPSKLLDNSFYSSPEFNRYRIMPKHIETIEQLAEKIENRKESALVVLNTVGDTKKLYEILGDNENEYVLLNTHFTLEDRQRKLKLCREKLDNKERIVLISTQLIEAGVDIDFPVVYRDLCPLPNLIQTAGRCNRNGRLEIGEVFLFELKSENGKSSASKVYGRNFAWFLSETKAAITQTIYEKDILALQNNFAEKVNENLTCGEFEISKTSINLIECVNKARFESFAKLKLIDNDLFGFEFRYYIPNYIPKGFADGEFEKLQEIFDEKIPPRDFAKLRIQRNKIKSQLQKMSSRIVNLRLFTQDLAPAQNGEETCGIRELANSDDYSEITGVRLSANAGFII